VLSQRGGLVGGEHRQLAGVQLDVPGGGLLLSAGQLEAVLAPRLERAVQQPDVGHAGPAQQPPGPRAAVSPALS